MPAASVAARRGATLSGLDASEALIAIARARTPAGDFRVGDMFALPFDEDHFDVATSFNGIWKGCEGALVEARRVARPGGLVGFTFWGPPKRLGLLPYFATVAELSSAVAAGPSWPAIQNVGYDQFAEALRQAMRPLYVEGIGVRIVSEFGWIIGKVPATYAPAVTRAFTDRTA